jgi:hypothetical protein
MPVESTTASDLFPMTAVPLPRRGSMLARTQLAPASQVEPVLRASRASIEACRERLALAERAMAAAEERVAAALPVLDDPSSEPSVELARRQVALDEEIAARREESRLVIEAARATAAEMVAAARSDALAAIGEAGQSLRFHGAVESDGTASLAHADPVRAPRPVPPVDPVAPVEEAPTPAAPTSEGSVSPDPPRDDLGAISIGPAGGAHAIGAVVPSPAVVHPSYVAVLVPVASGDAANGYLVAPQMAGAAPLATPSPVAAPVRGRRPVSTGMYVDVMLVLVALGIVVTVMLAWIG